MIDRIGRYTLRFQNRPVIKGFASVVGKKESEGPLKPWFDKIFYDTTAGEDTWEKSESKLQKEAVSLALEKAGVRAAECDMIFAGDLLNQCISSCFGLKDFDIPFVGQYGACSTMAQSLSMASIMVASGAANKAVALTSSHFCSAERQFRFPLEYGGQRTPTAQWTVTGSGSVVLSSEGDGPFVNAVTIGKMVDLGVTDANNMGAAMSPACSDTIKNYFNDTGSSPDEFDMIFTGDLGLVGTRLLYELLEKDGIDIKRNHADCGLMIFDREKQDVHAGGSGCGCSASVLCSYILKKMASASFKRVLFVATGAMMSPTSCQQGDAIPGIAHLIELSV